MILCLCEAVTDRALREAVRDGATTVGQVARRTRAATRCGSCACDLKRVLLEEQGEFCSSRVPALEVLDRDALPLAAK